MRKSLLLLLVFFTYCLGFSQEVTLRILGNSNYSELAQSKVFLLNFEYDATVCNPLTQNKTIDIQVAEFTENLKDEKISFQLLHKETLTVNPEQSKSYELILPIETNDYKTMKIVTSSGIRVIKTYYKFADDSFLYEDKRAVLAFRNAQNKALKLANQLHYQIIAVENIDDDTSDNNNIYELLGITNYEEEEREQMYAFFVELNELATDAEPIKEGAYTLWVTYQLKPI